jgi:hypothetical protein
LGGLSGIKDPLKVMLDFIKKWVVAKPKDRALNDFERLFARAMRDVSAREDFYRAFLAADLYISGRRNGPGEAEIQYYDFAGEKILPVFSHPQRLKEVLGPDAMEMTFKGLDLIKQVAPGQAVALNPYSDFGREFGPEELQEILRKGEL